MESRLRLIFRYTLNQYIYKVHCQIPFNYITPPVISSPNPDAPPAVPHFHAAAVLLHLHSRRWRCSPSDGGEAV